MTREHGVGGFSRGNADYLPCARNKKWKAQQRSGRLCSRRTRQLLLKALLLLLLLLEVRNTEAGVKKPPPPAATTNHFNAPCFSERSHFQKGHSSSHQ